MASSLQLLSSFKISSGGCAVGTDISNGWCQVAHNIAGSANTTSASVTINSTGADLIVVVVSSYSGFFKLTSTDVSDNKSNSFSGGVQKDDSGANVFLLAMKPTTVGANHTFTVSNAALTFPVIAVYAVSGSHASPNDQTGVGANNGTSVNVANITPSQDNELIISGWCLLAVNTGTPTINFGMTIADFLNSDGINYQTGGLAYVTQSTAAVNSPTWQWAVSGVSTAVTMSFKHA